MRDFRSKLMIGAPKALARKSGQATMIVAMLVAFGVLLGFVALAFDGGSALLQRRTQQNAAESGALAGIQLMGQNMTQSCNPAPCHPTYIIRNSDLKNIVLDFVARNQGGTVGSAPVSTTIEYHFLHDAPECQSPYSNCYRTLTDANYPPAN